MLRSLSTSEFARALGISDSSVRRLADSGEVEIHRTKGGHRRVPLAAAIRYVRQTRAPLARPDLLGLDLEASAAGGDGDATAKLLRLLESGRASSVIRYLQSLYASGMSLAEICDGPIRDAIAKIGERWPHDRRAIFIEHRAMTLCVRALGQLRAAVLPPGDNAPEAIGGGITGDVYLLPTMMTSLVLYDIGFNDVDLGPNTPLDVLADAVADEAPALVWLSISEPIRSNTQAHQLQQLADVAVERDSLLVIGGKHARDVSPVRTKAWVYCESMQQLQTIATRRLDEVAGGTDTALD